MEGEKVIRKPSAVGWSGTLGNVNNVESGLDFNLNINWDHEVLAITKNHVLVYLTEEHKKEYVSYARDDKGGVYSGFYTRDKVKATDDFVKRMRIYL